MFAEIWNGIDFDRDQVLAENENTPRTHPCPLIDSLLISIVNSVLKSNPEIKAGKGLKFHVQKIHFRAAQTENIESVAMKRRRIKV